ncbi:very-long-chain (3R)-3-hydroxyacyl-CoA dehydratase 3 [Lingula anatina]|uniref:Very-long-chain (3R)-3-hydroxyacyl-CoA dehydratase n=1 Tax=Lingula anatina TaxID=7574 RepID=A0A1S3HUU4_LINAN|nr:very-long-chain (3R)-3-hydroxyacyl-CoA dehydratase 3 [Lingula anatina]|eukprot:XP_013389788.1 very-long-chain (3R)-3-hydroxyacyl-CoA dehydratase 3 [Lingula anatina]
MAEILSPIVYWGQNKEYTSLNIELREITNPQINLTEDRLYFKANGIGGHGQNQYELDIPFFTPIEKEGSIFTLTENGVRFKLKKVSYGETWPRLMLEGRKPAWLRIDFEKMTFDDSSEDEEHSEDEIKEDWMRRIEKEIQDTQQSAVGDLKMIYLFIYNLFQFVGYSYIMVAIIIRYIRYGQASQTDVFSAVGAQMMICQIAALVEIINPLLGIVKTGVMAPLMQVLGRGIVVFMVIVQEPRVQESRAVWLLFVVYCGIEIVRYPYYILSALEYEVKIVTLLRYTLWIPLYPVGFGCEGVIIYKAIPYFKETGAFSVQLPNVWNCSFDFPTFLWIYLGIIVIAGSMMLHHMYYQTKRKLGMSITSKKKKK